MKSLRKLFCRIFGHSLDYYDFYLKPCRWCGTPNIAQGKNEVQK